jgi:hypothetical protein
MEFGNATTNPDYEFLGSGDILAANGTLDVPSATSFKIGGSALTTSNWTATAVDIVLGDGTGNADAYHTHGSLAMDVLVEAEAATGGVSAGEAIAMSNQSGTPVGAKADADGGGTLVNCVGLAEAAASGGASFNIIISGEATVPDAEWDSAPVAADVGKKVFMSLTPGNLTLTSPSATGQTVQKVGIVSFADASADTTRVLVQPADSVLL